MITVPKLKNYPYDRRHRLHSIEVNPVKIAVKEKILNLLANKEDLLTASILFRVFYRLENYCKNRPDYPVHDTWEALESYFGTDTCKTEEVS